MLNNNKLTGVIAVTTTATNIYTNTTGNKTLVKGFTIHNYSSSAVNFIFYLVYNNSGSVGTASNSNKIYSIDLDAEETYTANFSYVLVLDSNNDSVFVKAGSNSAINFILLGDVLS